MRLSELYNSVQGEGPKVGLATTFVRFAGCNLRCPGWPCDSQYAIDPRKYRSEWETVSPDELGERIVDKSCRGSNICLTGGEPWLQNHGEMSYLLGLLLGADRKVECFSNGTIEIPEDIFNHVSFVFDRKLKGSGEDVQRLRSFGGLNGEDVFFTNLHRAFVAGTGSALKYTVASFEDINEALEDFQKLCDPYIAPEGIARMPVYVGAVWGKMKESDIAQWLADEVGYDNWRLNVQVHKYIFDPEAREI